MTDVNEIKAGKYQLIAPQWDQITSKPGEPLDYIRHLSGAIVDLGAADAKRLVLAGAVVKPGQLEQMRAQRALEIAERAQRDFEATVAELPDDVRAEVLERFSQLSQEPATSASVTPTAPSGATAAPTVDEILADVGTDVEKAKATLEAEQAREGGPRSTLVGPLERVIAAGGPEVNRGSSHELWIAYATHEARGDARLSQEDAEVKSRNELADLFMPRDGS